MFDLIRRLLSAILTKQNHGNLMESFTIQGGAPLHGEIPVRGAKNSTDKCLAACLLTDEDCYIDNIPLIDDVKKLLEIFEGMGAEVEFVDTRKVRLNAKNIDPSKINQELVREMRMSVLLMGSMLARFGEVKLATPGGDKIGARQIDTHLDAFRALGAEVSFEGDMFTMRAEELVGAEIILSEFSVLGTVNAVLASVFAKGTTIIKNAAAEPHIDNVIQLLSSMGAKISWKGNHIIEIQGVDSLHGVEHSINPDYLEMWTFLVLAAATQSELAIKPFHKEYLELELLRFREMGGRYRIEGDVLTVEQGSLKAPEQKIHSMPFPGIAADNLPLFAVLATQAKGTTLLQEWMYEGRQKYVNDLKKMGADATILDPHRILIKGPTPLYAKETTSYDIRAGATLIVAALVAEGTSTVNDANIVDRGYEAIEERLGNVGAQIKRIKK